jgi:indolepyruvate ferredoxin oxidoreductase
LNGKNVEANLKAFTAGRRATVEEPATRKGAPSLQDFIARRAGDLVMYWNAAYAGRYTDLLKVVSTAAAAVAGGEELTWAVARSAYKLMAYKDEYEVARLYTDGRFREALAKEFVGIGSIRVHLAPPFLAKPDKHTGRTAKRVFGGWVLGLFHILHAARGLREGPLDLFGRSAERRLERDLRDAYLAAIAKLVRTLSAETLADAVAIAAAPLEVRGFGHVKDRAARALLTRLRSRNG